MRTTASTARMQRIETHYFHCAPPCTLGVPAGEVHDQRCSTAFAHLPWQAARHARAPARRASVAVDLRPNALPAAFGGWLSADLHVHMNYGGHYRNTPQDVVRAGARRGSRRRLQPDRQQGRARSRTSPGSGPAPIPRATATTLLMQAQEYHTSFWGHLGLLHLSRSLRAAGFLELSAHRAREPVSAQRRRSPTSRTRRARWSATCIRSTSEIDPAKEKSLTNELPADVAHGKVDYLEVVGFSDHRVTAARLVSPAQPGLSTARRRRHRRDGELRVAARAGRTESRVSRHRRAAHARGRRATRSRRAGHSRATVRCSGSIWPATQPGGTLARDAPRRGRHSASHCARPCRSITSSSCYNGRVVKQLRARRASGARSTRRRASDRRERLAAAARLERGAGSAGARPLSLRDDEPDLSRAADAGDPPRPRMRRYFVAWLDRVIAAAEARDDYNDDRRARDDARLSALGAATLSAVWRGQPQAGVGSMRLDGSSTLRLLLALAAFSRAPAPTAFGVDDLARLADVAEPTFSPDGEYVAYSVTTSNLEADKPQTDLWRVRFRDGSDRKPLTQHARRQRMAAVLEPGRPVASRSCRIAAARTRRRRSGSCRPPAAKRASSPTFRRRRGLSPGHPTASASP